MNTMEKTIALRAVQTLQDMTCLKAEYRPDPTNELKQRDGIVQIVYGAQQLEFVAEIKRRVNHATIGLVHRQKLKLGKILLLTDYVNPELANALKDHDIPFIDAAGNAYLKELPLYVFIKGNKPLDEFKTDHTRRLFKTSGLRVLFTLLNNPGAENNPYRDIAMGAGVALGTVGWVVKDLKETGFLVELGQKGRKLIKKDDLLRRWVEAYPEQLRPKLVQGIFRVDARNWWKEIVPAEFGLFWGGEIAATKLTGYLKPEKALIYTAQPPGKIVFKYMLKKDPKGNVEILRPFWNFQWKMAALDLVPPLLIYADLMATGDPRNSETAEMVYAEHLTRLVRKD